MKTVLLFLLLLIANNITAQDVKIEKDLISVDSKPYLRKSKCSVINDICSLYNLDGKEMISIQTLRNPNDSRFTYYKISFLGTQKYIESKETLKSLIKLFYNGKILSESGVFDEDAVGILVEKIGHTISGKEE